MPALQTIECDQDGEAISHATTLLESRSLDLSLEIWKGNRLLARVAKARMLAE